MNDEEKTKSMNHLTSMWKRIGDKYEEICKAHEGFCDFFMADAPQLFPMGVKSLEVMEQKINKVVSFSELEVLARKFEEGTCELFKKVLSKYEVKK